MLTRQNLPLLRKNGETENLSERGAYILADAKDAKALIWATGSEVEIALHARALLEKDGIGVRVVSAPSLELFMAQDDKYKKSVFGDIKVKAAIEAGVRQGWDHFIDWDGIFIGMSSFGESAPFEKLYAHFGITAENLADQIRKKI